jgi:hypothetical protein
VTAESKLDAVRDEVFAAMERFAAQHEAAQSELVREHLALLKARRSDAGALSLAIARALGAAPQTAQMASLVAGFTEAAAQAVQGLESETYGVRQRHDLPLALNSSDALLSLAHVALSDLDAANGSDTRLASRYDRLATALWEAAGEPAVQAAAAARLAGEIAAAVSGAPETAIIGAGNFAAEASGPLTDRQRAFAVLAGSGLEDDARAELASLLD